jgi:hypothetical protein
VLSIWLLVIPLFAPELQRHIGWPALAWSIDGQTRLRWLLSLLPAAFIVNHALFLGLVRVRQIPGPGAKSLVGLDDPLLPSSGGSRDAYFGRASLLARYGVPAVMSILLCATALAALMRPADYWCCLAWQQGTEWANLLRGARAGFAGAYIYVMLMLTQRTFRRDVTGGIALWSAAMFVLGPAIAAIVALIWSGDSAAPASNQWTRDAIYFVAGMAPRQFAAIIQRNARKWVAPETNATPTRVVPLGTIAGITSEIEERLGEEGITDANTLAMADPLLLLRSTSYDRRMIASWMDEALLITNLPDTWQKLQNLGIPGAIDLAWCFERDETITMLAEQTGMPKVLLGSIVQRLFEDAQVRIVWTLYQVDSDSEFDPENPESADDEDDATAPALPTPSMNPMAASLSAGEVEKV